MEREIVAMLNGIPGVTAKRVPLSGAMREYKDDIELDVRGIHLRAEVKARKDALGWKRIARALDELAPLGFNIIYTDGLRVLRWGALGHVLARGDARYQYDMKAFPKTLLAWLGTADLLILKADRKEPLVVIPQRTFERLK